MLKAGQRFAHRDARDAELFGEQALAGQEIPRAQQSLLDSLAHRGVKAQIQRHRARAGQILQQFFQQTLVDLLAHS
ncbi:hypothetical protein ACF0H2_10020 [Serratia marcescens]